MVRCDCVSETAFCFVATCQRPASDLPAAEQLAANQIGSRHRYACDEASSYISTPEEDFPGNRLQKRCFASTRALPRCAAHGRYQWSIIFVEEPNLEKLQVFLRFAAQAEWLEEMLASIAAHVLLRTP